MIRSIDSKALLVVSDLIKHFYSNRKHILEALGTKESHTPILHLVLDHPNCTQQQIAEIAMLSKSTVSEIITELEDLNMIHRCKSDSDKRKTFVRLTSKGEQVAIAIQKEFDTYMEEAMSELTDKEIETFMSLIKKMHPVK